MAIFAAARLRVCRGTAPKGKNMALKNSASAVWSGDLKTGTGTISTRSSSLVAAPYDFRKRFEGAPGTNPEELIGAAHAACFSMALSAELGNAGMVAESINTTATVTLDFIDGAPTVTNVHLDLVAKIPGADEAKFQAAAAGAKANCPISRLLKTEITLSAKLA
jgi:lipoyl-dependent peroxiredoxin